MSDVENVHVWVDAAVRDTGMTITGKHTLDPRKRVVDAAVRAHHSYLWAKADQAISIISEPELRNILTRYTRVLLGQKERPNEP